MNKRFYFFYFYLFSFITLPIIPQENGALQPKKTGYKRNKKKNIIFNYSDKPLVEIINELAAEKNENIILPQGAQADPLIKTKITYHYSEPLTIDQAWKQLISILSLTGYSIEPEANIQTIKKIDSNINRQILSVYINEPLENIPDNENIIRAVFYLANINLKTSFQDLNNILKDMLSQTADIRSDAKTNALIISDKATNIKAAMRIILELDKGGMRDSIEVIPLYYTSSQLVEDLFNKNLLATQQQPGAGAGQQQPEQPSYFPKNTKIIGLPRNNTLVIMGTPYAIDLVKDFIIKYIDRPLESGESILHIYDLQYLDAKEFQGVLQAIVQSGQMPGQQATGQAVATGPKQYFKDVIVVNEISKKTKEQLQPTTVSGEATNPLSVSPEGAQVGGNRLVIAARKKDWIRIKELIEQLDKPQLQVALEVIVADVTLNSNKLLGSQMRDKEGFDKSISERVSFQTAHLDQPVLKPGISNQLGGTEFTASALMSNLLQLGNPFGNNQNIANVGPAGSLVFSLKDSANGGVWSVWQVLNNYTNATLIAQPFVITQNHQQASVSISQKRFLQGKADSSNVAVKVGNEWVSASFSIDILPHISATGNINLQITVKINQFTSDENNTRVTRAVQTNANVGSGEILALGGLTREVENVQASETPPFSRFPIVGWFFKKKQQVKERNNLLILMSPTIIQPRMKGGIDTFTNRKLDFAEEQLDESVCYDNLRDPVTRWFFKPNPSYGQETVQEYTKKTAQEGARTSNENENTLVNKKQDHHQATVCVTRGQSVVEAEKIKELVKDEKNPLTLESNDNHSQKSILNSKKNTAATAETHLGSQELKDLIQQEDNPLLAKNSKKEKKHRELRPIVECA